MGVEIRPIERHEAMAYLRVLPYANGLPNWEPYPAAWHAGPEAWPPLRPPATDEKLASWVDELFVGRFHPQAAFVDGTLAGATAMVSFDLTVPGLLAVPMGGVTSTAVIATHRRRGLLRSMMQAMFDEALGRGEPLAGLSASEGSIYGRFGFSPATVRTCWEIDRHQAALIEDGRTGTLELVDAATAREAWPRLHAQFQPGRVGELTAQAGQWAGLEDTATGTAGSLRFLIHRDPQGEIDGIANYRLPWSAIPAETGTLVVEAMCVLSIDAERDLWRLLLDHDLTRKIAAASRPADEPLRWMLANPRALRVTRQSDNLWLRLLDLPTALESRGYETAETIVIRIDADAMCPANAGTWRLEVSPTGASCTRTTGVPDVVVDVQALGSLYLGGMSAATLAGAGRVRAPGAGRVRAAEPTSVARLSRIFRSDPAPHNSFGF